MINIETIIIIIALAILIYNFINRLKTRKEHLEIPYDDIIKDENCQRRQITDMDFSKKVFSSDEPEILFF
jgi:hypothetical protein